MTISLEGLQTFPLHFKDFPLEQLAAKELTESQQGPEDYRSRDGLTSITVQEFRRRNHGAGVTVYPFGARNGTSLAVRGSFERLPVVRFAISEAGRTERYSLGDGRALDLGFGIVVNDRSGGWGLGTHSFVLAGFGKVTGERGDGKRYFAEGGGGMTVGPFGVQLSLKFAYNRLDDPRAHGFFTVPLAIRGTVSF